MYYFVILGQDWCGIRKKSFYDNINLLDVFDFEMIIKANTYG